MTRRHAGHALAFLAFGVAVYWATKADWRTPTPTTGALSWLCIGCAITSATLALEGKD